ncbi:hypothetical protein JTB14_018952 [Gonioctena quinquepunctata]|nr:hypothetical protein JTB14_018952 [Gonioctena quinquepunctata]
MNFLSVSNNNQNIFLKAHNNSYLLSESPSKTTFNDNRQTQIVENNNQISPNGQEKTLKELWSKHKLNMNKAKTEPLLNLNNVKMTWEVEKLAEIPDESEENVSEKGPIEEKKERVEEEELSNKEESPSHHARRPPNAFLIFCKKHRPIVRDRFPNLENRGVTKILGEWWALLNFFEKQPYNDLAKEYKDAFLSANPDFRWYKLPAPPLRTLSTRPIAIPKTQPPLSSPSTITPSEFTPGKLADESQLGGLTSLMNNFTTIPKTEDNNNGSVSLDTFETSLTSPVSNIIRSSTPPKPIKKRFTEYFQNKECARNILDGEGQKEEDEKKDLDNMTKQDFMNKVVDGLYLKKQEDTSEKNGLKEVRKSERMCKGKRYELFMIEGRLLGNKRETKIIQPRPIKIDTKIETELSSVNNNKPETPKLDLENTIKRLAERTNIKIDFENQSDVDVEGKRQKLSSDFNLDLRISILPSLNYDEFVQRKRESKKRKIRTKTEGDVKYKIQKVDKSETQLVGSKKRKNKHSITHLGKKEEGTVGNELLGLATLAEVAANTEKINEKFSE